MIRCIWNYTVTYAEIISSGWTAGNLAISVFLIFTTILTITGAFDAMDDIKAISQDAQPDESNLHAQKRFVDTQWGMFKGLILVGFGLTALTSLYIIINIFSLVHL